MLVYRLEMPSVEGVGDGVFACFGAVVYDENRREGSKSAYDMPCPLSAVEEGTPVHEFVKSVGHESEYVFGFRSKTQLKKAFSSKLGRKALDENEVRVSVFQVPKKDVMLGFSQLIFNPKSAKKVDTLWCEDLESTGAYYGQV